MIVQFKALRPGVNRALVLALAQLLSEAQAGELTALAYVACTRREGCSADAIGTHKDALKLAEDLVVHIKR